MGDVRRAEHLQAAGRYAEAAAAYRRAAARDPHSQQIAQNLGSLLIQLGRVAEGEASLRRALEIAPDSMITRHSLGVALLAQGRFVEALPFRAARHLIPDRRDLRPAGLPYPEWQGEDLTGKRIVIFPEQGFGDQIQYARFVPLLAARSAGVTLLARPPLARIFRESFPGVEVVAAEGAVEFSDPDVWTMSSDLPGRMGATLETLPSAPYLETRVTWPSEKTDFTIGIVTRGNPAFAQDAQRSPSDEDARALIAMLPGRIVDLDIARTGAKDFADTAALMRGLDLVVSVDSGPAHLAGAIGKRCLLLLPGFVTDWRWLRGRSDSPWYPGHTLYRGTVDGDWAPAFRQLARDARRIAAEAGGQVGAGNSPRATPPLCGKSRGKV